MGGHRADADLAPVFTHIGEIADAPEVYEQRRLRQTQLHRRNQAVSAGKNFGVFVLRQQRKRFVQRFGANVIELCCKHDVSFAGSADVPPALSALARISDSLNLSLEGCALKPGNAPLGACSDGTSALPAKR